MYCTVPDLFIAIALAVIFCIAAYRNKWLDAGGAFVGALMGVIIWIAGGWRTTLPMLLFFISGSLFGRLSKKKILTTDLNHNKPRNFIQVLCNGGIAILCLLLWLTGKTDLWLQAYFLSISISTADTWSSELGIKWGKNVIDITKLKPLATGLSGGVTWIGTLSGLAGSILIGILASLLFNFTIFQLSVIIAGGFAGMLIDSILGSTLQARYRLNNGEQAEFITQHDNGRLEKGINWMTNDWVNLLSNFATTALGIGLLGCSLFNT